MKYDNGYTRFRIFDSMIKRKMDEFLQAYGQSYHDALQNHENNYSLLFMVATYMVMDYSSSIYTDST